MSFTAVLSVSVGWVAYLDDALGGDDVVLDLTGLAHGPLEDGGQLQHVHDAHAEELGLGARAQALGLQTADTGDG